MRSSVRARLLHGPAGPEKSSRDPEPAVIDDSASVFAVTDYKTIAGGIAHRSEDAEIARNGVHVPIRCGTGGARPELLQRCARIPDYRCVKPSPPNELPRVEWIRIGSTVFAILGALVFLGIIQRDGQTSGRIRVMINEHVAIESLETIADAQIRYARLRTIDADGDGVGEHGFFSELSGRGYLRNQSAEAPTSARAAVNSGGWLPEGLGVIVDDGFGNGVVEYQGYRYRMFLPGELAYGKFPGVTELAEPGALGFDDEVDAGAAANHWCCYAWPIKPGETGRRVFFINEEREVLEFGNTTGTYRGDAGVTSFELVYTLHSMDAALVSPAVEPGDVWTTVDPARRPDPAIIVEPGSETTEDSEAGTAAPSLEQLESRFQSLTELPD